MLVQIIKNNTVLATFKPGQHDLGRGEILQCFDQEVSPQHAILYIQKKQITLKAVHTNPLFYARSGKVEMVTKEKERVVNDGDKIAFLANDDWYTIRIVPGYKENVDETKNNSGGTALSGDQSKLKRHLQDKNENELDNKKPKIDYQNNIDKNKELGTSSEETPSKDCLKTKRHLQGANDGEPDNKKPRIINENDKENNKNNEYLNKNEGEKSNEQLNRNIQSIQLPSTSENNDSQGLSLVKKHKPLRDRCWFGYDCYRKNKYHFKRFSHPDDDDYETDPEDDREECYYGSNCYQTSRNHRAKYRHPGTPAVKRKRHYANRSKTVIIYNFYNHGNIIINHYY